MRTGAVGTKEQYDRATMRSFNQPLFTQEHNAEYSPASDSQWETRGRGQEAKVRYRDRDKDGLRESKKQAGLTTGALAGRNCGKV